MVDVVRYLWALPNTALGLSVLPLVLMTRGRARVVAGVLEIYGGVASLVLRHLPISGGAAAITFGHVVIGRDRGALAVTRRHERVHVRQYEIWGPFFIPAYLLASMWAIACGDNAYHDNYFEREAIRLEGF